MKYTIKISVTEEDTFNRPTTELKLRGYESDLNRQALGKLLAEKIDELSQ